MVQAVQDHEYVPRRVSFFHPLEPPLLRRAVDEAGDVQVRVPVHGRRPAHAPVQRVLVLDRGARGCRHQSHGLGVHVRGGFFAGGRRRGGRGRRRDVGGPGGKVARRGVAWAGFAPGGERCDVGGLRVGSVRSNGCYGKVQGQEKEEEESCERDQHGCCRSFVEAARAGWVDFARARGRAIASPMRLCDGEPCDPLLGSPGKSSR